MTTTATTDELSEDQFRRPHPVLFASEFARAAGELQAFVYALPHLWTLPRGDGHPVLVLPGFTADDRTTVPLRWFLTDRGYRAVQWRLGRNLGPTDHILDGMDSIVARLTRAGGRISIVGWSLGGIFARELGRRFPAAVRSVITLGSPVRLTGRHTDQTYASYAYEALSGLHSERAWRVGPEEDRPPMPVPVTGIFSRTDGVVPWQSCVEDGDARCESIEVPGSHSGLGHNPLALAVIADRLAQPDGTWKPYQPPPCLCGVVRARPGVRSSADG